MLRGTRGLLPRPIDDIEAFWTPGEKRQAMGMLEYSVVCSRSTVREGLRQVLAETGADELMVVGAIHDDAARLRSYEIAAEAHAELAGVEALAA